MQVDLLSWKKGTGWRARDSMPVRADLLLYFGRRDELADATRYEELRRAFPSARILGCSTGGQIRNDEILDDEIAAVAVAFGATRISVASTIVSTLEHSRSAGVKLAQRLAAPDLAGLFVLSDGLNVNGSELVAGIASVAGHNIPLTGGLAGDGPNFLSTLVGADCPPRDHLVAAVGFYGTSIRIGHGSAGGWDEFGPRRRVTRSVGNVLYELDGKPALDLYERYLGEEESRGLPSTGLLFPLRLHAPETPDQHIVRTILAVDREARSMRFAGDVPEGWLAQLMRGSFDRLAEGAAQAGRQARPESAALGRTQTELALLVSCIGRRLLMGQKTINEVEAAGAVLGDVTRIGFYSYGEISPHEASGVSQLHNQTMTITTLSEAVG